MNSDYGYIVLFVFVCYKVTKVIVYLYIALHVHIYKLEK